MKALIDSIEYRVLLTPMCGIYRVMINKTVRNKLYKQVGDTVHISIKEDTEQRIVHLPKDLAAAMEANSVKTFFESLSFSHQKEYVQ